MKIYENGVYRDMSAEELAQIEAVSINAQIEESTRPLSDSEILLLDMRKRVNTLSIDNQTAGRMVNYFPTMAEVCGAGELIQAKTRIRDDKDNAIIWRSTVDIWNIETNSPTNAPTLWDKIEYNNGIRVIPNNITSTLAWIKGEMGYYNGHIYKSLMDGNVFPITQADAWMLMC